VMPCAPRWSSPCFSSATAAPAHSPLSLHDALPIFCRLTETEPIIVGKPAPHMMEFAAGRLGARRPLMVGDRLDTDIEGGRAAGRSEEHTSELQSRFDVVCRLLLEKKTEERRERGRT